MGQAGGVQVVQGAIHPVGALVQGVVAGSAARVVPGGDQRGKHLRWDGELRVAAERAAGRGERGFQMADAQVGALDVGLLGGQHRREVQALPARGVGAGLVDQRRVQQHIPGHHERHALHPRATGRYPRRGHGPGVDTAVDLGALGDQAHVHPRSRCHTDGNRRRFGRYRGSSRSAGRRAAGTRGDGRNQLGHSGCRLRRPTRAPGNDKEDHGDQSGPASSGASTRSPRTETRQNRHRTSLTQPNGQVSAHRRHIAT